MSEEELKREVDTDSVKCRSCGAAMEFDPASQLLKCSRCGSTMDFFKSSDVEEIGLDSAISENAVWKDETLAFRCESCGATVVAGKAETATCCPFCGAAHVVAFEDMQGIKPNAVVPFSVDKKAAAGHLKNWAKRKFFAPNDFKKHITPEEIRGVYMPFFTFDSNTDSVYEGRVGDRHSRTVHTKNGTRTETYVVWRNVSGTFSHFFDDILINAGKRLEEKKLKKLSPFNWSAARVYDNEYLTGFVAHRYERDIKTCWEDAKQEIDEQIRQMIIDRCHCDEVDYLNVRTRHEGVTYKYVILPVYVMNFSYKKKNYVIYQNGSTGKTVGKAPTSPWKVAGLSIGIAAFFALMVLLWYMLFV